MALTTPMPVITMRLDKGVSRPADAIIRAMSGSSEEVEVKLPFPSAAEALSLLGRAGATARGVRTFEDNALWDRDTDPLALGPHAARAAIRRTRRSHVQAPHRGRLSVQRVCEEHETEVEDPVALEGVLRGVGFRLAYGTRSTGPSCSFRRRGERGRDAAGLLRGARGRPRRHRPRRAAPGLHLRALRPRDVQRAAGRRLALAASRAISCCATRPTTRSRMRAMVLAAGLGERMRPLTPAHAQAGHPRAGVAADPPRAVAPARGRSVPRRRQPSSTCRLMRAPLDEAGGGDRG